MQIQKHGPPDYKEMAEQWGMEWACQREQRRELRNEMNLQMIHRKVPIEICEVL